MTEHISPLAFVIILGIGFFAVAFITGMVRRVRNGIS